MHFKNVDGEGRRYRERVINGKAYRYYADEGRRLGSVWTDIPAMVANTPLRREATGYPTQKPEKLLAKIILASTNPGDLILDPLAGVGTTAVVAKKLRRRSIAIERDENYCLLALKRLELAETDKSIQGFSDGVFWERNSGPSKK